MEVIKTKADYLVQQMKQWRSEIYLEQEWMKLYNKYPSIYVHVLPMSGIGEIVPRLAKLLRESVDWTSEEWHIIMFTYYKQYAKKICNERMLELFGKRFHFIDKSNIDLWEHVLRKHRDKIIIKYQYREKCEIRIKEGIPIIPFAEDEINEAENKMRTMGVQGEYVCLHVRNVASEGDGNAYYQYRTRNHNTSMESMEKACGYLRSKDLKVIRMGKYEKDKCLLPGVIDYAYYYYDELMDFYLLSKCKFVLGSDSGLLAIAPFWGRPALYLNTMLIARGWSGSAHTGKDMYIPQRFWSVEKNRYLDLWEMLEIQARYYDTEHEIEQQGIIVKPNDKEVIADAIQEMNERIDGVWEVSQQEVEIRRKWDSILKEWETNHILKHDNFCIKQEMCKYQVCYSFLKRNLFLMDLVREEDRYMIKQDNIGKENLSGMARKCRMLDQWIHTKQDGKKLCDFLLQRGYGTVAIYGMDYVGESVRRELENTDITVLYGIDKNAGNLCSDIRLAKPDDDLDPVDVVVVTAIVAYDDIKLYLHSKLSCPIVSLEDIFYTMMVEL